MKVVNSVLRRMVNQQIVRSSAVQTVLSDAALTPVWQKRFYDFNVSSTRKRIEKLRYMHEPVKRQVAAELGRTPELGLKPELGRAPELGRTP